MTGDRELELLGRYEENAYFARMMKIAGHLDLELIEIPNTNHAGVEKAAYPHLLRFLDRLATPAAADSP